MRILFLTQWFDPEPSYKGIYFAKALCDNGHEVQVLTGFPNYPGGKLYAGYRIRPWQRETVDGITVNRVPLYPSHDTAGIKRIINYLSLGFSTATIGPFLVRRPDVIYVYNLITLGWAAGLLRALHRCPIVLDVQDLWPDSVLRSGMMNNRFLQMLLRHWCLNEYHRPDHLIVQSPGFKQALIDRGIPETRINVIYNWCDESAITIGEAYPAIAQKYGFHGRFNVVFAGTMGRMQAIGSILEAAEIVLPMAPQILFTFVGGGIEVERLQRNAAERGLSNVQFLSRRPMQEIGTILSHADALLVHLKRDPLFSITIPSKVQTYLYAGKPIIIGVEGDAADIVTQAGAGITCCPEDPESIARAILKLAALPKDELLSMGRRARAFYFKQFGFAVGVQRFEQIFQSVAFRR